MSNSSHTFEYDPVVPSSRTPQSDSASTDELVSLENSTEGELHFPSPEPQALAQLSLAHVSGENKALLKRGHAISYAGLFLFTAILYFRPYELIPALSSLTSIAFWSAIFTLAIYIPSQFGLEGNVTARPREVNLVIILCLAALISMPLAISPAKSWEVFNEEFIKAVLMFIVLVNVVRTERRLKGLLFLTIAVSCYLSWTALRDYSQGNFMDEFSRVRGGIGGMFGNPNDMALHLVTTVPIIAALLLSTPNIFKKAIYGVCAVLIVCAIIISFSRGGFLGLAAAGFLMAWKFGRRNRFVVILLTSVVVMLFLAFAPGGYGKRLASIFNSGLDVTGSASARGELLNRSIIISIANPLFGVGMGNFPIVSIRNLVSHNAYTQVAAEMGFTAALVYTLFMISPLKRMRRIERETLDGSREVRKYYFLAVGLQASLVGYMVSSFFVSVAYQFYVYYLVGYTVCLRRLYYHQARVGAERDTLSVPGENQSQLTIS